MATSRVDIHWRGPRRAAALLTAVLSPALLPGCSRASGAPAEIACTVTIPAQLETAALPGEAKLYVYVSDRAPKDGREVTPWEAPVVQVRALPLNGIDAPEVTVSFANLPPGTYGLSVLVDAGRPFVREGSRLFLPYPGDWAGGPEEPLVLAAGERREVAVGGGIYLPVPEGFEAPLFNPE